MATIQEAVDKGFLKAKRIKVAHVDININIPADVILYKNINGNIYFKDSNGNDSFHEEGGHFKWASLVYEEANNKWATILEYRKEDLVGRYIKVLKKVLGGASSMYKVGDYLEILSKGSTSGCHVVRYAGTLNLAPDSTRITNKEVEIMPEGFDPTIKLGTVNNFPKLNKFPEGGVCWNPTKQLYDYLILRTTASPLPSVKDPYKALAWNSNNIWGVQASSSQTSYDISQLTPFFNIPKEPVKIGLDFMDSPNTDNFEIGKTYYIRDTKDHSGLFMIAKCEGYHSNDKDRINGPYLSNMMSNPNFNFNPKDTPWIGSGREVCLASEKDTKWLECCIQNKKFIELENVKRNPEPLPDHIKHYPLTPEDCYYPIPNKWCIVVTSYNEDMLQEFLEQRSYLWLHYSEDWKVSPGGTKPIYFHFPPASQEPCHSHWKIQKGYTEITTEQFKQYYNSNSNSNVRQQEQKSGNSSSGVIKIQRPNFEIRSGDPIRATSFRCSKGKINLGG